MTDVRTVPQSIEAERAVLGACFLDQNAMYIADARIPGPRTFYEKRHQLLWSAFTTIHSRNEPIDSATVMSQLDRTKTLEAIGGAHYLADIINATPTSANIEYYLKLLIESYTLRETILMCQLAMDRAFERDKSKEVLGAVETQTYKLLTGRTLREASHVAAVLEGVMDRVDAIRRGEPGNGAIETPWAGINATTGGLRLSELTVVAARPSKGKTAIALNMAKHAASLGHQCLFFSLEMSKPELAKRLVTMHNAVDWQDISQGEIERWEGSLKDAVPAISSLPIWIDDSGRMNLKTMSIMARRRFDHKEGGVIFFDYLQKLPADRRIPRHEQLGEYMGEFKNIAKDLNVAVVVLVQLSRDAEEETIPRRLHRYLKDSGSIEQEADVILTLSTPNGKGEQSIDSVTKHYTVTPDEAIFLQVNKHRNGKCPRDPYTMRYAKHIQRFYHAEKSVMSGHQHPHHQQEEEDDCAF
jgi:replicative DNA helicase